MKSLHSHARVLLAVGYSLQPVRPDKYDYMVQTGEGYVKVPRAGQGILITYLLYVDVVGCLHCVTAL